MSGQSHDHNAETVRLELAALLDKHGVQLLPVAVSPSGSLVPVGDFLPERWRIEIRIIEAQR